MGGFIRVSCGVAFIDGVGLLLRRRWYRVYYALSTLSSWSVFVLSVRWWELIIFVEHFQVNYTGYLPWVGRTGAGWAALEKKESNGHAHSNGNGNGNGLKKDL